MNFLLGLLGGTALQGAGGGFGPFGVAGEIAALGPGLPFIDVLGRPSGRTSGGGRRRRRRMLTASDVKDIAALAGLVGSGIAGKAALIRIARA